MRVYSCVCVCVYCLGASSAESTSSLFDWSCLKVGPLMNRLLLSVLEPGSLRGISIPPVCHNDRDGLWGAGGCRVFSIRTSCCRGLPHGDAGRAGVQAGQNAGVIICVGVCIVFCCHACAHWTVWVLVEKMERTQHLCL